MSHSAFDKALDVLIELNNLQLRELSLIHAGLQWRDGQRVVYKDVEHLTENNA